MPQRVKLTDAFVAAAKCGDKQHYIYDTLCPKFALRLIPTGGKTLGYWWALPGKNPSFKKIAVAGTILVDEARKRALAGLGDVAWGRDPTTVAQKAKLAVKSRVGAILADGGPYEKHLQDEKIAKWGEMLRCLKRYVIPALGNRLIGELTTADVVEVINQSANKNDVRKYVRGLLWWAVNNGLAKSNVLTGLQRRGMSKAVRIANDNAKKGRMFTDAEIVRLWQATEGDDPYYGIVRLCLLTGMRKGEAAKLTHTMVEADRIVLPAENTKQGRAHAIPLTPLMREELGLSQNSPSALVFPSPRDGVAIQAWSQRTAKLAQDARFDELRLHDLRKTCRSLMSRFGVRADHAALAIGHKRSGLDGTYDLYEAWDERVAAFEKVDAYIRKLIKAPALTEAA